MKSKKIRILDRLDSLSYPTIFLMWAGNVFLFAVIYAGLSFFGESGPTGFSELDPLTRLLNGIYFSIITATNTGYGDIVPQGISKLFAATEAFSGLFLFALFISKLVSRRESIAIAQMHKISFEGTFHNIREDLHTVRMDFDKVLRIVRDKEEVRGDDWHQLIIALRQIESLISEVPSFYDETENLYRIDARRELLLLEAFERTLERFEHVLAVLSENGIDWMQQEKFGAQTKQFLDSVRKVSRAWTTDAGKNNAAAFKRISEILNAIEARLE